MTKRDRIEAIQSHINQLEHQLLSARQQLEQEATAPDDAQSPSLTYEDVQRINAAMHFVSMYQQSIRPVVLFSPDGSSDSIQRDPHPKELSAMAAACDMLEQFFDSSRAGE